MFDQPPPPLPSLFARINALVLVLDALQDADIDNSLYRGISHQSGDDVPNERFGKFCAKLWSGRMSTLLRFALTIRREFCL